MQKVILRYKEKPLIMGGREEEYTAGPYYPDKAKQVQAGLAYMGAHDFKMEVHNGS